MRTQTGALVAAVLGSAVVAVDTTAVGVALPSITDDLGGGLAGQQWVANAYLLTLAALILVSGALADRLGERRVFVAGVAGFGIVSVACALAPTIGVLVAARALQGVCGALLTPAALAIIVAVFDPAERGKAIGTWTAYSGVGILVGPLLGGQLVDALSWRWVFAINVPLALATLALASKYVPTGGRSGAGEPPAEQRPLDLVGCGLCALGLAGPTFALIEQPLEGWGSPLVWLPAAVGLAIFAVFLRFEERTPEPMLPLGLFGRRNFRWGNVQTLAQYGGLAVMQFFLGLFLQQVAGWSALKAGSTGLVTTSVMLLLSRRFGALADAIGPRRLMAVGPVVAGCGMLVLLTADERVTWWGTILPSQALFGLGLAMCVSPLTTAVLADAEASQAGIASAVNNAIARTAGLLATAAVGAVLAGTFASSVDDRVGALGPLSAADRAAVAAARERTLAVAGADPAVRAATQEASVATFHRAVVIGASLMVIAGLLGGLGIQDPRRRTPEGVAPPDVADPAAPAAATVGTCTRHPDRAPVAAIVPEAMEMPQTKRGFAS